MQESRPLPLGLKKRNKSVFRTLQEREARLQQLEEEARRAEEAERQRELDASRDSIAESDSSSEEEEEDERQSQRSRYSLPSRPQSTQSAPAGRAIRRKFQHSYVPHDARTPMAQGSALPAGAHSYAISTPAADTHEDTANAEHHDAQGVGYQYRDALPYLNEDIEMEGGAQGYSETEEEVRRSRTPEYGTQLLTVALELSARDA